MSVIARCPSTVTYVYGATNLPDATFECDREAGHKGPHWDGTGRRTWTTDGRFYGPASEVPA